MVSEAVKVLQKAFGMLDPTSEAGRAILESINKLGKVAPVSQAAPGIGPEALRNLAQQAQQEAPLAMLLRKQMTGGVAGPPQAPAPGGAAEAA